MPHNRGTYKNLDTLNDPYLGLGGGARNPNYIKKYLDNPYTIRYNSYGNRGSYETPWCITST